MSALLRLYVHLRLLWRWFWEDPDQHQAEP